MNTVNKKLDPNLKLRYKISQYENSLKLISESIERHGPNNHTVSLEYYYENKIASLKMKLKETRPKLELVK